MLNINYEFRKGIFFLRLFGNLNKETYKDKEIEIKDLIVNNKFKYIVVNTNSIKSIDLYGINYILEICNLSLENQGKLIICDKSNIIRKLLNNNFPNIKDELEVL